MGMMTVTADVFLPFLSHLNCKLSEPSFRQQDVETRT